MSFTDAVSRVSQIQAQIASLSGAFQPAPPSTGTAAASPGTAASPSRTGSTFAAQLAAAQDTGAALGLGAGGAVGASGIVGDGGVVGAGGVMGSGGAVGASGTLPAGASSQLTSSQQTFASRLAADTGLDSGVISAWLLAEESGSAAQSRQAACNNDWLNIGYTDSGTYGSADAVWSDPTAAADATAGWLKGQNTIPGYGTASPGVQAILSTAGQSPAAQIAALQSSGWASSGYPDLPSLYQQVAG